MGEWIRTKDRLPEQMHNVLFITKSGSIYKGFLNLGNSWLIQNTNGLISKSFRDDSCVIAWMELPDKNADWNRQGDKAPEIGTRILSMDRMDGNVTVVDVGVNYWVVRNSKDDHIKFHIQNHPDNLWMPLPEYRAV